jgi:hypothetical protein
MRKWTAAIPVAVSLGLSVAFYNEIPLASSPDFSPLLPIDLPEGGPVPRLAAALLIPVVALGVWLLLTGLAKVTSGRPPLPEWLLNEETGSKSIRRFEPTYGTIVFGVTALLALMHAGLLAGVLGSPDWIFQALTACLGFGIAAVGNVIPRMRPNWIAGVRTKRTLSDAVVWSRTHRVLGASLIAAGIIVVAASIVAPRFALVTAAGLVLLSLPLAHFSGK